MCASGRREMDVTTETDLIIGKFYWVQPALDPGTDAEWEAEIQPARFAGKNSESALLWNYLAIEGDSDWPMRWIGGEIEAPGSPKHRP